MINVKVKTQHAEFDAEILAATHNNGILSFCLKSKHLAVICGEILINEFAFFVDSVLYKSGANEIEFSATISSSEFLFFATNPKLQLALSINGVMPSPSVDFESQPIQTPPPVMTTDEAREYYAPALQQEEVAPSPKFERIVNNINDIIQRDFRKYECAILDAKLSIGQYPSLTVIIAIEVGSNTDTHTILSAWHNNSIVWLLNCFFMVTEVEFKANKEKGFGRLAEVTLYANTGAKRLSDARMAAQEIERQTRSTNNAVVRMPYNEGAPGGISNTQGAV